MPGSTIAEITSAPAACTARKHHGAVGAGDLCGSVAAPVSRHEDPDLLRRIGLRAQTVNERANHCRFIMGRDQNCKCVIRIRFRCFPFSCRQPRQRDIRELVGIAHEKQAHDDVVDRLARMHDVPPPSGVLCACRPVADDPECQHGKDVQERAEDRPERQIHAGHRRALIQPGNNRQPIENDPDAMSRMTAPMIT